MMTTLHQLETQLKEIIAGRPKVYRAWDDTWSKFNEDPDAYYMAHEKLRRHDAEKNRVLDDIAKIIEAKLKEKNT